jgi:hypothetical protein
VADEALPPGAYEAADEAFANWIGPPDPHEPEHRWSSGRDELEAALLAAAPLIRADERARIAGEAAGQQEAAAFIREAR